MVTQKDMQDAFEALLRGDERERDRILNAAQERDRREAERARKKAPIVLEPGPDGVYRFPRET